MMFYLVYDYNYLVLYLNVGIVNEKFQKNLKKNF